MLIGEKIQAIEQLQQNIASFADESFVETKDDYAQLNTEQMNEGELNDGTAISPGYTSRTIQIKKRKGQPYDRVTLKDTGAFYSGYTVQPQGDELNLDSSVSYATDLTKKYSDKIWGLNDKNRQTYAFGAFWNALKKKIENLNLMFGV